MITVRLSTEQGRALKVATAAMANAGAEENKHKKAREAAKTIIARELKQHRQIKIEDLPDKEVVVVLVDGEDVLKIERKSSQRLDQAGLAAAHPDIATEFTKPSVATYFSNLVSVPAK